MHEEFVICVSILVYLYASNMKPGMASPTVVYDYQQVFLKV